MRMGADPEIFLMDKNERPVSAIGKFEGTKNKPVPIPGLPGYYVQVDNVAVEYNIPPAKTSPGWFSANTKALTKLTEMAESQGLSLLIASSVEMPEEELIDPRAWIFGCDPDYNAWTFKKNPKPESKNPRLRSAGGHIHIEMSGSKLEKAHFVRLLDKYVGAWIKKIDPDKRRQELYGDFGAFRYKPYGVEYRTPSNYWLKSSSYIIEIWERTLNAYLSFEKGERIYDFREILKHNP